ncbi:MAG: hypothetical protein Q9218_004293 [Villophora microphyllina]
MDPISVAASILGLLGAAAKVAEILANFVKGVKDAPKLAQRVFTEVEDLKLCFQRLQEFINLEEASNRSRAAMITVDQLLIMLTNCVMTFSELEDALGWLKPGSFSVNTRLRWLTKEHTISKLLQRLQSSKVSLNLVLTTLNCTRMQEAQEAIASLTTAVNDVLTTNRSIGRHLENMDLSTTLKHRSAPSALGETAMEGIASTYGDLSFSGRSRRRKKLVHCMRGLDYAIYVADLNGYCQYLKEDLDANQMRESLQLFESLLKLPELAGLPIFLFLNKADLFETTILREPILDYFMDYTGGADYWKGTQYFANLFARLDRRPAGKLHCYVTDSLDTPSFQKAWSQEPAFEKYKDVFDGYQSNSPPIVIRWNDKDGKSINKVSLPPKNAKDQVAVTKLIESCTPAPFGKDGKTILDESYRKAAKLESDQFSTNFNPNEVGIIGAIAQTLLPGIARLADGGGHTFVEDLGIVAELYKLNIRALLVPTVPNRGLQKLRRVYSAPSGKFKMHVDTPRGVTHFGSLVVCLPSRHQGGALHIVRGCGDNEQEMIHSWDDQDTQIEWAAFYSDCSHEVEEVTAGHRITLTYNPYAREQLGTMFRQPSPNSTDSFMLSYRAKEALADPSFFPNGGTLGFHCTHAYAHQNNDGHRNLALALKGADAMILAAFHNLGLHVEMRVVMEGTPPSNENTFGNDVDDRIAQVDRNLDLRDDDDNDDDIQDPKLISTALHGTQSAKLISTALHELKVSDHKYDHCEKATDLMVDEASLSWAAIVVEIPSKDSEVRKKLMMGSGVPWVQANGER